MPKRNLVACLAGLALAAAAWGDEDPTVRALQQHQLQRQQNQDALQLRMQQQQREAQSPPAGARQQRDLDLLQTDQQQRQQQLHYRQAIEPASAQPSEDEAGQRAKSQMELQKAQDQGQQQLRRFESELQVKPGADTVRPKSPD
jgi:hypothetical protein